jgi:hypothetical protein
VIRPAIRATLAAAGVAAAALALTASGPAAAGPAGPQSTGAAPALATCAAFTATNPAVQTRVVTTSDATLYTNTPAWADMACGATAVTAPRGRAVLAVAQVDAEVTCTGPDGQWCQARVLIGNAPGEPQAPEPDSFSWANSEPNAAQWEANTLTRTRDLACPRTWPLPVCTWPVRVQVRTHAPGLLLRVDDSTVHVAGTYH